MFYEHEAKEALASLSTAPNGQISLSVLRGLPVFGSAESGGATQDRVLGRRRPPRRWTRGEESGGDRLRSPARPGRRSGRRRPEHLEVTLAIFQLRSGMAQHGGGRDELTTSRLGAGSNEMMMMWVEHTAPRRP